MATTKTEFATKTVAVIDDAIVISFVSDGVEKKKTMPFTEAWLKVKNEIKAIIESEDYNINNIWRDLKEWGNLYGFVVDLAEKQRAIDDKFAALKVKAGLTSNPIDELD